MPTRLNFVFGKWTISIWCSIICLTRSNLDFQWNWMVCSSLNWWRRKLENLFEVHFILRAEVSCFLHDECLFQNIVFIKFFQQCFRHPGNCSQVDWHGYHYISYLLNFFRFSLRVECPMFNCFVLHTKHASFTDALRISDLARIWWHQKKSIVRFNNCVNGTPLIVFSSMTMGSKDPLTVKPICFPWILTSWKFTQFVWDSDGCTKPMVEVEVALVKLKKLEVSDLFFKGLWFFPLRFDQFLELLHFLSLCCRNPSMLANTTQAAFCTGWLLWRSSNLFVCLFEWNKNQRDEFYAGAVLSSTVEVEADYTRCFHLLHCSQDAVHDLVCFLSHSLLKLMKWEPNCF